MRTDAARRERFLPYWYERASMAVAVDRCLLDDRDHVEPDRERCLLELDVPWKTAAVTISVEVPLATRNAVLPPSATGVGLDLLLVVQCPGTFRRFALRSVLSDAVTRFDLQLRRNDFAGHASLQAFLVRSSEDAPTNGFATQRGMRLADSRAWELRFDRPQESRGEYLDVRYHPFSTEPSVPQRDRRNLYLLLMEQETPELWVNSDHQRIAGVLDSKGTVGSHARLREVIYDQIAHGVWTQLFMKAASDYLQNEEATYPWQDAVLDLLLKDIFPEVQGHGARRDALSEAWGDLPALAARLDAALQRRSDISTHISKLLEEAEE
jgi:hypothetical protein